jgi:hypothetical protein
MNDKIPQEWSKVSLKDVSFLNIMKRHIYNVLIVANPYDAFMLEDDGRVEEKVFSEYMELGLRYPPMFTQVSTIDEAEEVLATTPVDLVICMPGNADNDAFTVARAIKTRFPNIHCVVLTPFSHGITRRMENEDLSIFDYVFCWLGNTNLILSIIKLIEDKMNLDHDIREGGVQMILLVEDSIRFYSSILPNLYSYILQQSHNFATEALNRHSATLRMRGRPKVVLARTYEEALALYERYRDNCLGVISDVRFPVNGEKNAEAGFLLLEQIRKEDEYVPLIMESAETANAQRAVAEGFHFVDKNSKVLSVELRHLMEEHMGFGDFIFRDPKTHREIMRIHSLKELQDNIFKIPADSMLYHISRNHISRWLCARAIFPVSNFLKHVTWHKLQDVDAHRQIIFDAIVQYRRMKNMGVVAVFDRGKFDRYAHFARIGEGSLGGKGRGLAFPRQHHQVAPRVQPVSRRDGQHPHDGGAVYRRLRPVHGPERPLRHRAERRTRRGHSPALPQGAVARQLYRRLLHLLRRHPRPHRGEVEFIARGQPLPAFRRHLFHLYDTPVGRPPADALHVGRSHQERLCVGLLPRLEGLYDGHIQRHRPGEDGGHPAGGGRPRLRRPVLP